MIHRSMPNEPKSPISFETISLLLRSPRGRVIEIAREMPDDLRTALALYCAARAHMRQLGFTILPECTEASVQKIGGKPAVTLYWHAVDNPAAYDEPQAKIIRLARCA